MSDTNSLIEGYNPGGNFLEVPEGDVAGFFSTNFAILRDDYETTQEEANFVVQLFAEGRVELSGFSWNQTTEVLAILVGTPLKPVFQ